LDGAISHVYKNKTTFERTTAKPLERKSSSFMISVPSNFKFYCICIVAIGNPERHVRKASHRGSKQQ